MELNVDDLTEDDLKDIVYFIYKAKERRVRDEMPDALVMESDREYVNNNIRAAVGFLTLAEEIKARKETKDGSNTVTGAN